MIIKGTITAILETETGKGKNNEVWKKRIFVIKYEEDPYVKEAAVEIWGDLTEHPAIVLGNEVIAHIDIISKLYEGKYYTSIKVWRLLAK